MMQDLKLSPLDLALTKVKRLELEAERYEIRLSALRCKVLELLSDKPTVTIIRNNGE